MSELKKKTKKQILRQHIATTIAKNLMDLRETLGEKKFNRKVKKATRVLTAGLPKQKKSDKKKEVLELPLVTAN
ncbi:hypothetical protein [Flavitalea sp.]|nr:hypothetical protein [Flavitalea sp.]